MTVSAFSLARSSDSFLPKRFILVFLLATIPLLAAASCGAEDGVGAGAILQSGVDARALGMGGAFVAVADNYSATYWNPAGIARAAGARFGGMHTDKFGVGLNFNFLAGGASLSAIPSLGSAGPREEKEEDSFSLEDLSPLPLTGEGAQTESLQAETPSEETERSELREEEKAAGNEAGGTASQTKTSPGPGWRNWLGNFSLAGSYLSFSTEVRATDPDGNPVGVITYSERAYLGTLGLRLPAVGLIGGSLRNYRFKAPNAGLEGENATANGLGFDMGLMAEPLEGLWLGAAGFDVGGTNVSWKNTPTEPTDLAPAHYSVGASYGLELEKLDELLPGELLLAGQYDFGSLVTNEFRLGLEYDLFIFSVRGGGVKPNGSSPYFTAGAGIGFNNVKVDAAWIQNTSFEEAEDISDTIILSAEFSF